MSEAAARGVDVDRRRPGRGDVVLVCWSVALAVLLLGPALGRGFVLTYDMVWVPDLALRPDSWGLGSGVPRAVPSDAVVGLLDELVPGDWLQHLVLVGSLVGGGLGAARLVPSRTSARLVAVVCWQWNPFVVERLVIGHWPILVAYGVLPWLLLAARGWREGSGIPPVLLVLLPLASLSASAGVAASVVLLVAAGGRRRWGTIVVLGAAANLPWVAAGLLHAGQASVGAAGSAVFAASAEGPVPAPVAALTLGGIWNADVVPDSRSGVLGWLAVVVLLGLVGSGWRRWWRGTAPRDRRTLVVLWVVGWGLAVVTWSLPAVVDTVAAVVPGGGLLRDGSRLLLLCAPLLVVTVVHGVLVWLDRLTAPGPARYAGVVVAVLVPVALLPDAALGVAGRLDAVTYPPGWARADAVLDAAREDGSVTGDLLVLPRGSFRRFAWNGDRTVLDPTGRYLAPDPVADDVLVVDGRSLGGEDPRARAALDVVDRAVAGADPAETLTRLAGLGIGAVAVSETAAPPGSEGAAAAAAVVDLPGAETLAQGGGLGVVALPAGSGRDVPWTWSALMALAWTGFGLVPAIGLVRGVGSLRARRGYPRGSR